jgi:hypothetical protein
MKMKKLLLTILNKILAPRQKNKKLIMTCNTMKALLNCYDFQDSKSISNGEMDENYLIRFHYENNQFFFSPKSFIEKLVKIETFFLIFHFIYQQYWLSSWRWWGRIWTTLHLNFF